ncbi:MAG: type III-A CRISPR-associated RAMP protein Csm4, partial [Bacteroidales bacterium]|nr:type III-A CRISPR-associated RAMP protein Csm4 [Bacteroidales bacterium]
ESVAREKDYKKLTYVPHDMLSDYLSGNMDIVQAKSIVNSIGSSEMRQVARVNTGGKDAEPYRIGSFYFNEQSGLYFILGYESDSSLEIAKNIFEALSLCGVGGRRSSGLGKFVLTEEELPEEIAGRIDKEADCYMTLSISLPKDDEIEDALADASYQVVKRSGFVASEDYNPTPLRKKDLFACAAGSCFSKTFKGSIVDVSSHGSHAVYRYAKPLFISVDQEVKQ